MVLEAGGNSRGAKDPSDTSVLQWWGRYHLKYPEIANLARRRLCAQASSATSEHAFSKVGLVNQSINQSIKHPALQVV